MQTLIKVKRRFFFRSGINEAAYSGGFIRVEDFAKAHEFLDVKIEIGTGKHGIPAPVYDALIEGRYREAQAIAIDADTPLRLSITGTAGYVAKPKDARREALQYNVSLFEDGDYPLPEANQAWGTNFRSPLAAARYVLQVDGEYAGLDVVDEVWERRGKRNYARVLVGHSFGCLHDDIKARAPELAHLIPWHMSDMKPGSPSQMRAEKEGRDPNNASVIDDGPIYVLGRGWIDSATYRYGSGWVVSLLPDGVLAFVLQLHQEDLNGRASDAA